MVIDPAKPIPLYFQVKSFILSQIDAGYLQPGDRLPTEHEFCDRYGISRTPVHRALAELADEGVIIRRRRHGTVVNPHWLPGHDQVGSVRAVVADEEWLPHLRKRTLIGIDVNVMAVGYPGLHRHLVRAVSEGAAPDLMLIDSVWVGEFADAGILAPLDELAPGWMATDYNDFVPRFVHDGRVVAIPAEANVGGLWYNVRLLNENSLEPPTAWSDLERIAGVLAERGHEVPIALPTGSKGGETTTYCLTAMLSSNDASATNGDTVTLAGEATIELLAFVARLVEHGAISVGSVTYEWDSAPRLLARSQAAMSVGGTYEAALIASVAGVTLDRIGERFGFVPFPTGPRGGPGCVRGGMVWAIPHQSRYRSEAMQLLRACVEPSAMEDLALATGTLPSRRSVATAMALSFPHIRATAEHVDGAAQRPTTTSYQRVSTQMQLMIEAVVAGRRTPAEAAAAAAGHIAAITGLGLDLDVA